MKRLLRESLIGLLLLPCATLMAGTQWSGTPSDLKTTTFIKRVEVLDGAPVVRLQINPVDPEFDPASCGNHSYVDIPLTALSAGARQELINTAYYALLNHHHVLLGVLDNACSPANPAIPVLDGIRVLNSRHHANWPHGDNN